MDIEEKTYTALIGGITVIEFEDFIEAKNTGNGQEIMVSYIGDDDDIIATYQDLSLIHIFETYWPGLGGIDLLVGLAGAAGVYLLVNTSQPRPVGFK